MARTKQTVAQKKVPSGKAPRKNLATKAARKSGKTAHAGGKAPRKYKPGATALKEIRHYQMSSKSLISKLPFARLVKKYANPTKTAEPRFQGACLEALRESLEAFIVSLYDDANLCAIHARRCTVMSKDIALVKKLRRKTGMRC